MANKKSVKTEGGAFSREFLEGFEKESDFLKAMNEKTYTAFFEGDPKRAEKLKEVYQSVHGKKQ